MDSAGPDQPEDSPEPESSSASSSLGWDAAPPPPIARRKAALVEAAFRGRSSAESAESAESEPGVGGPGGGAADTGGGGDSGVDGGPPRLSALQRSLSAEPEPEPGRSVRWPVRRLRSLADRKAGLEAALLSGAERPAAGEFDDFTVHLYRKTADFAGRRSRIAELVFGPVRRGVVCRGVACSGV